MFRSIVLVAVALLACGAPVTSATPTAAASGPPRVTSVVATGDAITVTFDRPMLQIGEGSGVEMAGNYPAPPTRCASRTWWRKTGLRSPPTRPRSLSPCARARAGSTP